MKDKENDRVLVFEPHPDDVAFQIAGSVYKWIKQGREVMICTVTTGNNSTFDPGVTKEQIAEIMAKEHGEAMKILGVRGDNYVQWKYDDLGLDPAQHRMKLLENMVGLIRKFKPSTVVTLDPKNIHEEENPDHRLVAMTGFEAAALAAYPNLFPEQLKEEGAAQHFVSAILFYMTPEPDTFIDISGEPFSAKVMLGQNYESQLNLMVTEARERLAGLGASLDMFEQPAEIIWPQMCRAAAEETARACQAMYPDRENIKLAEAFRLKLPGVLDKIWNMLPDAMKFDFD